MAQMRKMRSNNQITGKEYEQFYNSLPMFFTAEFVGEAFRYSVGVTLSKYSPDKGRGVADMLDKIISE